MGLYLNYQKHPKKKNCISVLLLAFYALYKCIPWFNWLLQSILIHSPLETWWIILKELNGISEHYWQYSSHFLCLCPIIFLTKRNISHWALGSSSLNQEGAYLQPDFMWQSCRKEFSFLVDWHCWSRGDGQGGLGRRAVWGDSHGWAAQRRDIGSHSDAVLWAEVIVHLWEKQQERMDTETRDDSWHWGSWDQGCLSIKGISEPIIRVWFSFPCRNPNYCHNGQQRCQVDVFCF